MWWVAILALFVLLEKVAPKGSWVGRVGGILLIIWGLGVIAGPGGKIL